MHLLLLIIYNTKWGLLDSSQCFFTKNFKLARILSLAQAFFFVNNTVLGCTRAPVPQNV